MKEPIIGQRVRATMDHEHWVVGIFERESEIFAGYGVRPDDKPNELRCVIEMRHEEMIRKYEKFMRNYVKRERLERALKEIWDLQDKLRAQDVVLGHVYEEKVRLQQRIKELEAMLGTVLEDEVKRLRESHNEELLERELEDEIR